MAEAYWRNPLKWNRQAEVEGRRHRVFCASMADVFEDRDELSDDRQRLWELVDETPWLDWQLLTKRPQNVLDMVPSDWLGGVEKWSGIWPGNVWVGTTIEDQQRADERIPVLLRIPAAVRFVSCEPLLGPIDLGLGVDHRGHQRDYITNDVYPQCLDCSTDDEIVDWTHPNGPHIGWVICGGESGAGARPMDRAWALSLAEQCDAAGVAFHFKQLGAVLAKEMGVKPPGAHLTEDDPVPTWMLRQELPA